MIGFIYCGDCFTLRKKLRRHLKTWHLRRKYPPDLYEFRFYLPETNLVESGYTRNQLCRLRAFMPEVRSKVIEEMIQSNVKTFAAV